MVGQLFARLADGKLGKELEENLPRLFAERSARLVKNDEAEYAGPRAFDHAVATVATVDLELRFVRVGGGLSIDVRGESGKWQSLESLGLANGGALDWPAVDRSVAENWNRLKAAAL